MSRNNVPSTLLQIPPYSALLPGTLELTMSYPQKGHRTSKTPFNFEPQPNKQPHDLNTLLSQG